MNISHWTIGESVVVRPGVLDPVVGNNIGGYQGRISAISADMRTLTIQWDSQTLKDMPAADVDLCEHARIAWPETKLAGDTHVYLKEHLTAFPFMAIVKEDLGGSMPQGDQVKVLALSIMDESYGTIVSVRYGRRKYALPLWSLWPEGVDDATWQLVRDYSVWFSNQLRS